MQNYSWIQPAWRNGVASINSRVIVETRDSSRLFYKPKFGYHGDWDTTHTFCYQFTEPFNISPAQRTQRVLNDLNYYTGFDTRIELRNITYYELVRAKNGISNKKASFKGLEGKLDWEKYSYLSVGGMLTMINDLPNAHPVFDKTNLDKKRLDASIFIVPRDFDYSNIRAVRKYLAKVGLDIREKKGPVQMLVIKDGNTGVLASK